MEKKTLHKGKLLLATAALTLSSAAVQANDISYTNAEVGYQMLTGDGSFDGFQLRGSYQINEDFYVAGGYDQLKDGIEQTNISLRGGMRFELEPNVDLYGEAGLVRTKVETYVPPTFFSSGGTSSNTETGIQLEGGARMMATDEIEGRAYLRHINVDGYDETFLGAQGVFYATEEIGLYAGAARLFDASEFLLELGARYSF